MHAEVADAQEAHNRTRRRNGANSQNTVATAHGASGHRCWYKYQHPTVRPPLHKSLIQYALWDN